MPERRFGKRKPNEQVIKDKRKNEEKAEEDMREEEDNGRGNGKWHDAVRSEGSYTSLFLYFELIIFARRRRYKDRIRHFVKRNTVLSSPLPILCGWEAGRWTGRRDT